MARQPKKWTLAEDQKLRTEVMAQMVEGETKDWCRIALKLPGRTNKDCRKRWHNSVAGGLKKGQWAKSEDALLAQGVERYGQRWTLVAEGVASRSADQCAKRWQQSLDPELDRSEWREDEDHTLIRAVQQVGRHWKDIQRAHFPGRSKNCIKNRYTVLLRRYQNQGVDLSAEAAGTNHMPPAYLPPAQMVSYLQDDGDDSGMSISMEGSPQISTPDPRSQPYGEDQAMFWSPPQEQLPSLARPPGLNSQQYPSSNTPISPRSMPTSNYSQWSHQIPLVPQIGSGTQFGTIGMPSTYLRTSNFFDGPLSKSSSSTHSMEAYSYASMASVNSDSHILATDSDNFVDGMENPSSVKVTLTWNQPNTNTINDLVRIAMEHQAPLRLERD